MKRGVRRRGGIENGKARRGRESMKEVAGKDRRRVGGRERDVDVARRRLEVEGRRKAEVRIAVEGDGMDEQRAFERGKNVAAAPTVRRPRG
ncbi:hypothetical protein, partial [Burkholderia thailandensis]|uniref:hypothetical protein n=1 Tax=Burkholderia thailandensis TaxID=57975 RepID=UPI00217EA7FB